MNKRVSVSAIVLSASTLVAIAVYEGYKSSSYYPIEGDRPTIGFGTTEGVKPGQTTDPVRALVRLNQDASAFAIELKDCINVPVHQYEFDAFVSMAYNIGTRAFCKSTLVKKLNSGDYAGACAEMDRWVYAGGKVLPGLVKRRADERKLCEGHYQ